MLTSAALWFMLVSPWQVGPAPSAHPTAPSVSAGASAGGSVGGPTPLWGARVHGELTPHGRLWTSVELAAGQGWRTCIDCRALSATWTARGLLLSHKNVSVAAWSVLTTGQGAFEWTPGLALEAGTERVRVDTSWPVWSTWDLLTLLRITPELGVAARWSPRHATRVALVGLEPTVAVTHRVRLRRWLLEATARYGEEGFGLMLGLRWWSVLGWARRRGHGTSLR